MASVNLSEWTVDDYERAAQEYLANLPLEHFMEATPQGMQREITLESLALVRADRADVHLYNELLVQYPINAHLGQVVPDNMVVVSEEKPDPLGSYNLPFETAWPFWMLEYVSSSSERKDYEDNFQKYEHELKVPYYLLFHPEKQDLHLYHHTSVAYEEVEPNAAGRLEIPELEIEVAILDGWVRYWYQGKLLPLPAELLQQLRDAEAELKRAKRQTRQARREARELQKRANQADERANQADERANQADERADEEQRRRTAVEAELEQMRQLLKQMQQQPGPVKQPRKKK